MESKKSDYFPNYSQLNKNKSHLPKLGSNKDLNNVSFESRNANDTQTSQVKEEGAPVQRIDLLLGFDDDIRKQVNSGSKKMLKSQIDIQKIPLSSKPSRSSQVDRTKTLHNNMTNAGAHAYFIDAIQQNQKNVGHSKE